MEFNQWLYTTLAVVREDPILSGLAVLVLYFFIRTSLLSRRVTRLTKGADGKSLESTIHALNARTQALEAHAKKAELAFENLDARMKTAMRGVAVEHFDPFQQNGGQQSFVTAFINEAGDGAIISGIHSRDGVRVYAKQVRHMKSERELSEEEARTLKDAHARIHT